MEMRWKISYRAVYEKFGAGCFNAETQRRRDGRATCPHAVIEGPFEIQNTWCWVKVGDVFSMQAGKYISAAKLHPQSKNHEFPCYGGNGIRGFLQCYSHDGEHAIVGRQGALCGNLNLATGKFYATEHAVVVDTFCGINAHFAYWFLMAMNLNQYATATAQPGLSVKVVLDSLFPLPPLAEQKRIVAKIEKLMPLVEEYGKMEETRLQLDADLPAMLEKSILQEAIQGKLVPQDPNDEPASELLKRIAAERKALVKAGKLKCDKSESVIFRGSDRLAYETRNGETVCIQDEIPFDIPDSWEWVRLGDMSNYGQCKSVDTTDIAPDTWSLDLEEIEKGTGRLIERKTAADKKSKSSKHVFTKGTLLYSKLRTYLNKVLVADMDGVCTSEIVPIELNGGVNAEYVRLVLMSPYFLEYTASKGYGIKMPRVGTDDMKQSLIPLPPLDEQKRIVKRVEELKGTARTLVTF